MVMICHKSVKFYDFWDNLNSLLRSIHKTQNIMRLLLFILLSNKFECSTKGIGGSNKKYQNQLPNRYPINRYINPALNQLFNPEFIENSEFFFSVFIRLSQRTVTYIHRVLAHQVPK
jgi:hypothetical protein